MEQTTKVKCPSCNTFQDEDIHELTMDFGEMEGSFILDCDYCWYEIYVEYEYKSFVKTT